MDRLYAALSVLVLAALIVGGVIWSRWPAPQPVPTAQPAPTASPPVAAPEPAIKYPIETTNQVQDAPAPAQADKYLENALVDLLGRKAVSSFLNLDGFVRRVVSTVDNLTRSRAPSRLWPVRPIPGRFSAVRGQEGLNVNPDNAMRYAPFVAFVESVDTGRAVALYARLYPLFQRAYEELGYPGRYFNDRLVGVIDELLAAPDPAGPLKVELPEVKGPVKSVQPRAIYHFADPVLESLSAGQKMLLRTGPANERRLKAKLADIRRRLTAASP